MRSKSQIELALTQPGIIAVIRTKDAAQVAPLCDALVAGGVVALEITMTTPHAIDAIRAASARLGERAVVGVGTVLDAATCRAAIEAGAEFVVTPVLRPEVATVARASGKPVMIGAFTPTEAQHAHEAGADFIKIFPADSLGPGYIKNLLAPLPHLRIVPTGGVSLANVADFLKAGCAAVGVGSPLMTPRILAESNWPELTRQAAHFVKLAREARG
jgi:2-dehydro-3-deoxyphosphogluconate aldolase/(4S)-4-hydroxy-2-oxoglutarate aldolase